MNLIDELEFIKDEEEKYKLADKIKEKIRKFRQAGLDKAGEFSNENLAFKIVRNKGYMDKLKDLKTAAQDKMLSVDELYLSLDEESSEKEKVKNILGVQKGLDLDDKKIQIIKDFINFTQDKLGIKESIKVFLHGGRNAYIQTTASYLPTENENHIRVGGRAIVDILRSIGHELTHNKQREIKKIGDDKPVQNIGGEIEDEANAIAGILIKDFTHNYGFNEIYDM
jgi:hypothetical protein